MNKILVITLNPKIKNDALVTIHPYKLNERDTDHLRGSTFNAIIIDDCVDCLNVDGFSELFQIERLMDAHCGCTIVSASDKNALTNTSNDIILEYRHLICKTFELEDRRMNYTKLRLEDRRKNSK